MQKNVVISRYIKPNSHKKFGNFIRYIATREGVEKPVPKQQTDRELDQKIFMHYLDSRPNSHGLFSDKDNPIVLDRVAKEVANHKGAIWTQIVSLKREDAERTGFIDLEHWQELVRRHILDIAATQKIKSENIRWYACQCTLFGAFAPNSKTAEAMSQNLGKQTVLSGSVSRSAGKGGSSRSLQMIERPLLTVDELKSMPKGHFIVMKTGCHPMKTRLKLFFKWGIQFENAYSISEKVECKVQYADCR